MAFFKVDAKAQEEVRNDKGGVTVIDESGIFNISIKHASVSTGKGGSTAVDFNLEGEDGVCTVYGMTLFNNDGSENFQHKVFASLLTVLGIEEVSDPEPVEYTFGSKVVTLNTLLDLSDQPVRVKLQKVWSVWNGQTRSKLVIKRFYRAEDGATGSEILNGVEPKQLTKDMQYAGKDAFKDGLTAETVTGVPNAAAGTTSAPAEAPKANPFAK